MRRSEGEGTGLVRGEAGVVFDKLYLISHGSRLTGVGGENIVNAMQLASQPASPVERYFLHCGWDVMLDDWHLKCIILQDRNLHDDTVT